NLGANGVFDPISLDDGSATGINQWVSGDDSVLNLVFRTTVGGTNYDGDFASTAALDLSHSSLNESSTGRFNRTFIFEPENLAKDIKLGIRWFPGLQAADY